MLVKLARWIQVLLGDRQFGHPTAPGTAQRLVFGDADDDGKPMQIATTYNNDGCELWLGYRRGRWQGFYRDRHARQLAWFILWTWWAKGTWFGLKRWLWYKTLHIIANSYRQDVSLVEGEAEVGAVMG